MAKAALAIVALAGGQGCISYTAPVCQGGLCDVGYKAIVERDPKDVVIHADDEAVPEGAIPIGIFSFPGSIYDRCREEIRDRFRRKAAKLGYDGVAAIKYTVGGAPRLLMVDGKGGTYDSSKQPSQGGNTLTGAAPVAMSMQRIDAPCSGVPYVWPKGRLAKK